MAVSISQNLSLMRDVAVGSTSPLDLTVTRNLVSAGAFVETVPGVEDAILERSTGATAWNEFVITTPLFEEATLEVLNPDYGTLDGNRLSRAGSGGMVQVKATSFGRSAIATCNTGSSTAAVTRFSTYAADSDSLTMANAILSLIGPSSESNFFTDYVNTATGGQTTFTKNTDCWLYGVDMSGCAIDGNIFDVYSSANKGALITSRHLLGANHWQSTFPAPGTPANSSNGLRVGQSFRFRGEDGVVHSRQIIGVGKGYGDCVVATLNSALPESVTPFKLAGNWQFRHPATVATGLKSWWNGGAVFYLDQGYNARFMLGSTKEKSQVYMTTQILNGNTYTDLFMQAIFMTPQQDGNLLTCALVSGKSDFFREGIVGDSGSGIFYLIGGEAILVGTFYYPNWCHAIGLENGAIANDLIALADANAGVSTGLTVTVAPDPTL